VLSLHASGKVMTDADYDATCAAVANHVPGHSPDAEEVA
jgi:hypothetical protein